MIQTINGAALRLLPWYAEDRIKTPFYDDMGGGSLWVSAPEPGSYALAARVWSCEVAVRVFEVPSAPPVGSFDAAAAARGKVLFSGKAECATCHVPPLFTEPGWDLHTPAEIGIDSFQANRAPDLRYRTAPPMGLWTHTKGGFYHDGRFATLLDVVNHYNTFFTLGLTDGEKSDLVEYLKSLGAP